METTYFQNNEYIALKKKKEKASPPSLTSNFIPAKLFVRRFSNG